MFLNLLDRDEKRAFLVLAERLIESDGVVIGREATALAAHQLEMGITGGGDAELSVEELARVFKDRRSRVVALLELFGLAYSDTSFSMSEKSLIAKVAHSMGMTMDELGELEGWVQEYVSHVRKAMTLMR